MTLIHQCADCRAIQPPTDAYPERCEFCHGHAYPTEASLQAQATLVAQANDRFRKSWGADPAVPGRIVATCGVAAHGADFGLLALLAIMSFDAFTADNDPYGWHDFASLMVDGIELFWKIDLMDGAYEYGADQPEDPARTRRLLTILLPSEW